MKNESHKSAQILLIVLLLGILAIVSTVVAITLKNNSNDFKEKIQSNSEIKAIPLPKNTL